MNAPDLVCPFCRRKNSFYHFWCEGCQGPLAQPARSTFSDASARAERERKQLYERVLADLDQLAQSHEVTQEDSDTIRTFYRRQLSAIEKRAAKLAEALSIESLIRDARNAAQERRISQAVEILRAGTQKFPGAFPSDQMLEEVQGREAHERSVRAAREANDLLSQSKTSLRLGKSYDAQQKLARASELDPSNQEVQAALLEVNATIAAERSQAAAAVPEQVSDSLDEDIVMASLVEPDSASDSERDNEPVEAEVVGPIMESQPSAPPVAPKIEIRSSRPASALPSSPPVVVVESSARRSFAETDDEVPNQTQRLIDAASQWSTVLKPFLVDNVGWFVGAFLVIAGFVVLIVSFWGSIEQNRLLMHSLVYISLAVTTGMFFAMAYFMRLKYPQLENSSNVLLVIVALLIPLVFAAAVLTTLVPGTPTDVIIQASMR